jgi:hypothetical protein
MKCDSTSGWCVCGEFHGKGGAPAGESTRAPKECGGTAKRSLPRRRPSRTPRLKISELDSADPNCKTCMGLGWVCENHPEKAWADMIDGVNTKRACACGAGAPCRCNPLSKVR